MKSALEIALEKTKDIEPDDSASPELPAEAKQKLKALNEEYNAKIAELEIKVSHQVRQIAEQYGEQELQAHAGEISSQLKMEKDRINAERKEKTEALMAQYKKS